MWRHFCQDQEQDQDFYLKTEIKTKTLGLMTINKTKTLFFVLEAPRDQDFGHTDCITDA